MPSKPTARLQKPLFLAAFSVAKLTTNSLVETDLVKVSGTPGFYLLDEKHLTTVECLYFVA